jgi:glycosyltransferase involved in cell wall biosynthesis
MDQPRGPEGDPYLKGVSVEELLSTIRDLLYSHSSAGADLAGSARLLEAARRRISEGLGEALLGDLVQASITLAFFSGAPEAARGILRVSMESLACQSQPPVEVAIFDPGYRTHAGHHLKVVLHWSDLLESMGLRGRVYRGLSADPEGLLAHDRTGSLPAFPIRPYCPLYHHLQVATPEALRFVGELYAEVIAALPVPPARSGLQVLGPGVRFTFLEGMVGALARASEAHPVRAFLRLVETDELDPRHPHHEELRSCYRRVGAVLAAHPDLEVSFGAETQWMVDLVRESTGHPVHRAPYPVRPPARSMPEDPASPARFGFVGQSRPQRGLGLLRELLVPAASGPNLPVQWVLQLAPRVRDEVLPPTPAENPAGTPAPEVHGTQLSDSEYYDLLASLDVLVLPYGDIYAYQGSGISAEAAAMGIVQVLPEGCTMAADLAEVGGGYVTYQEASCEAIRRALREALENLPALRRRSRAARERWLERYETFDAEIRRLLEGRS